MKYKLINTATNEEHLCDKVTIDGFDYYVSDEIIKDARPYYGKWQVEEGTILNKFPTYLTDLSSCRLVIATNYPSIDIPKVVDGIEKEAMVYLDQNYSLSYERTTWQRLHEKTYKAGYNKSQETHPFSEEDLIEFAEFVAKYTDKNKNHKGEVLHAKSKYDGAERTTDLLQLWKEQQPKIVYYNE